MVLDPLRWLNEPRKWGLPVLELDYEHKGLSSIEGIYYEKKEGTVQSIAKKKKKRKQMITINLPINLNYLINHQSTINQQVMQ